MHDENSCILLMVWFTHHIHGIVAINIVAYKTHSDLQFNLISSLV